MSAIRSALLIADTRIFFEEGHLRGQPPDLLVQLAQLLRVGVPLADGVGVVLLEQARGAFQRGGLPDPD
jgi:hypothetical protein